VPANTKERSEQRSTTELVKAAADGDSRAWDAIVERYAGMVWAVCRGCGLNRSDAAEVSQTTWLRLVEHLGSIHDPERLGSWLAVTARRESWQASRRSGRSIPTDTEATLSDREADEDIDRDILARERHDLLRQAFETLHPRCQRLLRLLTADPAPAYVDVAAALDMPIGSIGPTRARCLDCLRKRGVDLMELVAG
jgi:RNA polymerase sigma factor (sigma-70 family)